MYGEIRWLMVISNHNIKGNIHKKDRKIRDVTERQLTKFSISAHMLSHLQANTFISQDLLAHYLWPCIRSGSTLHMYKLTEWGDYKYQYQSLYTVKFLLSKDSPTQHCHWGLLQDNIHFVVNRYHYPSCSSCSLDHC